MHSLEDTAKLLPFLLVVYFLIEFLEYKNVFRFEKSKLLNGKASPVLGSCFGVIPQCGFSVISAELFSEKKMSMAALVAVFLATSDEAFPILISNYKSIPVLIVLLITKFLIALIVGYFVMFLSKKIFKNSSSINNINKKDESDNHPNENHSNLEDSKNEITSKTHEHEEHEHSHDDEHFHDEHEEEKHEHSHDEHKEEKHSHIHACCHHDISDHQKFNWKHPIIHSIKIFIYIFVINVILGSLFEIIGEDKISNFLASSSVFQPLIALVIGFIPNCASSVIITELYMQGMISFGSIITGLCANAGLGLFVLLKNNKNKKENIFIVSTIIISSLIFGYIFHLIPIKLVG